QSFFQVGGNLGSSLGPLLGAFLVVPHGQPSLAWCSLLALAAIAVLWRIGGWSRAAHGAATARRATAGHHVRDGHLQRGHEHGGGRTGPDARPHLTPRRIGWSIAILAALL